jgi:HSP20 family protein
MAEPQVTTASGKIDKAREPSPASPAAPLDELVQAERRTFNEARRGAQDSARSGFEAARDAARQGAETTRQFTEQGRRAGMEIATLWREAFDPLLNAQLEASRWFEQLWRQTTGVGALPALYTARPFAAFSPAPIFGLPPADVKETAQDYQLSLELPGLALEELDIEVAGEMLTIRGQKREEREDARASYRLSERRFGRFERSFPVPADADAARIEAQFRDGVLKVTLPKQVQAAPPARRIEIRA